CAGAAYCLSVEVVVVIAAIHLQVVESSAQAAEAQIARANVGSDTRGEQQKLEEVAAVQSEAGDLRVVDRAGNAGPSGFHSGSCCLHLYFGCRSADGKSELNWNGLAHAHAYRSYFYLGESRLDGSDFIVPHRKQRERVKSGFSGHDHALKTGVDV